MTKRSNPVGKPQMPTKPEGARTIFNAKLLIADMEAAGYTAQQTAAYAGLSPATLGNLMRGEGFQMSSVDAVAWLFGRSSLDYLQWLGPVTAHTQELAPRLAVRKPVGVAAVPA